ncbi:flavin reductase family protein [Confluentibacter flavum]|uniref:Flavin reductase n=1 Tax=Confluentibacter flavum TaxID=1909700 RepID=A0A2N3HK90_9FLAO|nr:flavin reductase family protein [Confluentibacter flavum]PKQ45268.1 flavin reductase [Confluentibacter flavum]
MITIDPNTAETRLFHQLLLGSVAPRPIALASTVDAKGHVNLSPFSFFNCFSANPPILVFSPARRVRNNTTKHTLENIMETKEVVINIVNHAMVEQTSLSSVEFEKGVDEFIKAGFTATPSKKVVPPRVTESPVSFECQVIEVRPLGHKGGAGHLVICEVLLAHFDETIFDENERISPQKLDAVARMGDNWYCRANGQSLFELPKPGTALAVGFEALPKSVLKSDILTGNNLARLASVEQVPTPTEEEQKALAFQIDDFADRFKDDRTLYKRLVHEKVKYYIEHAHIDLAWKFLLTAEDYSIKNRLWKR